MQTVQMISIKQGEQLQLEMVLFLFYHKENLFQICNNLKYIFTVITDSGFTAVIPIITVQNALSSANAVFPSQPTMTAANYVVCFSLLRLLRTTSS